jgi:hypothetical protein
LCACPSENRRATYVIFDGLSVTLAGDTSGVIDDGGVAAGAAGAAAVVADVDGTAVAAGFALCEHAASNPAQINEDPTTE